VTADENTADENTAGGTPLPKKLGVEEGHKVAWLNAPDGFGDMLGELPAGVSAGHGLGRGIDVLVQFVTERAELARKLPKLKEAVFPAGAAWIAWPKKASKVPTDVTEDVIREECLPLGLVDVKVCAIDETWSGLKLVVRKELRGR
jgi:hypothetical protein